MRGQPGAIYSRIKLMFASGEREEALTHLRDLAHDLTADMVCSTRHRSRSD
jgi:hypothetical protein